MKNIIERIVGGGAKIASYLPKAVSTRLLVLALGLGLTATGWAVSRPVAVWNRDFPLTGNTDTRGNLTLDLNGNTSDGVITIGSGATGGVRINKSTANLAFVAAVVGIKTNSVDFSKNPAIMTARSNGNDNTVGLKIQSDGKFVPFHSTSTSYNNNGPQTSYTWPSGTGCGYFSFLYNAVSDYGSRGTYAYTTTKNSHNYVYGASGLVNQSSAVLYGLNVGGLYTASANSNIPNLSTAQIEYIAIFDSDNASSVTTVDDFKYWSLSDMTSAETISSAGGNITSGNRSSCGVNLNGGTVNVTANTTIAALFVQADTTLNIPAATATLTINGPIYIAGNYTLTVNITSLPTLTEESPSVLIFGGDNATIYGNVAVNNEATLGDGCNIYSTENGLTYKMPPIWDNGTWSYDPADGRDIIIKVDGETTFTPGVVTSFGCIYVNGSGTLSSSSAISADTIDVDSGVTVEMENITVGSTSGDGGVQWSANYPTIIPAGRTYKYVGSNDSANPATHASAITVNGKLETSGYLYLSAENKISATGELEVRNGRTKMNAGENGYGICGTLTIDSGAVFENARTADALNYGGSPTVNVYGTLDMASTRWTIRSANNINIYAGSTITGTGQSTHGALDSDSATTYNILAKAGQDTVNFDAMLRLRTPQTFNIAAGVTVNCTGTVGNRQEQINITGSGTFKIATGASFPSNVPFNIASSATLELAGGTVAGTITGSGRIVYPTGTFPSLTGLNAAGWTGRVEIPAFTAGSPTKLAFNNLGNENSTIIMKGCSSGHLWASETESGTTINPTIDIAGTVILRSPTAPAAPTVIKTVTGSGTLRFERSYSGTVSVWQIETLKNFTGSLGAMHYQESETLNNVQLSIGNVALEEGTELSLGQKAVTILGKVNDSWRMDNIINVDAAIVTIGGETTGYKLEKKSGGLYVAAVASATPTGGVATEYATLSAAKMALGSNAGTITLLMPSAESISLANGQVLNTNGKSYTGTVTPTGDHIEVASVSGIYMAVDNSSNTWQGFSGGAWGTATNWEKGVVPNTYTAVTLPANSGTAYSIGVTSSDQCGSITVNGDVTLNRGTSGWQQLHINGNISGSGTLTLNMVGLMADSGSGITVSCVFVGDGGTENAFVGGKPFTFENPVVIKGASGSFFKNESVGIIFNDSVEIQENAKLNANGADIVFCNSDIRLPSGSYLQPTSGAMTITDDAITWPSAINISGFAIDAASGIVGSLLVENTTINAAGDVQIGTGSTGSLTIGDGGVFKVGSSSGHKWLTFKTGSGNSEGNYITINEGGELEACVITFNDNSSPCPYAINFNGGKLKTYCGMDYYHELIHDTGIQVNVLAGGAKVEVPATYTATINPVMASGAVADGGLTKLGAGSLVVGSASCLPTYNGKTKVVSGALYLPSDYAANLDVTTQETDSDKAGYKKYVFVQAASFGGESYDTVAAAIDAAEDAEGGTVTLLRDCDEDVTLPIGVSFCDGGYTYYGTIATDTENNVYYNTAIENGITTYSTLVAAASLAWNNGTFTYYTLLDVAVAVANANLSTYLYVTILADMEFVPGRNIRYKIADGVTATPIASSIEYGTPTGNTPDANGAITYNTTIVNPTTYTWSGADIYDTKYWARSANWKFGVGDGTAATRKPQAGDSVVINTGATITIGTNESVSDITIGAAAPVAFTATSAKTLTVSEDIVLHNASASLVVNSNVTITDIGNKIGTDVADKCIMWANDGSSVTYSVADPVAQIGDVKYGSLANALENASDTATITILANMNSVGVGIGQKVVVASGVTVGTISWGEEYAVQTNVTGDGTTEFVATATATTFYSIVGESLAWTSAANWKVGTADGATATRAPTTGDTAYVVADSSVTIASADAIDGLTSLRGTGTLVLPTGSLPSSSGLTALLKNENWEGAVWIKNKTDITGTNFLPNEYGNTGSVVKLSGIKGWINATSTSSGGFTINPTIEVDNDIYEFGLWLSNGNGYNQNTSYRNHTVLNGLKGSGTLKGSDSGGNALLLVKDWENFTGTLTLNNKIVVFGDELPEQAHVEGGGFVVVNSNQSVTVPAGKTWTLANGVIVHEGGNLSLGTGAAIANTTAANTWIKRGTGTVTLNALDDLPASPANDWSGTVVLPSFAASSAWSLNNCGNSGSTVEVLGITGGWISEAGRTVAPTLKLTGDIVISAMSSWTYTFAEITGSGNLSFATTGGHPTAIVITKVAEGYSGTISNTTESNVVITTLDRQVGTTVTPGTKLLTKSGNVTASALTVGGVAQSVALCAESDGIYVAAASVQKGGNPTTYHTTVADAMTEAGSDVATITLLGNTDSNVLLAVGQSLVTGGFDVGTVSTSVANHHVVNNAGVYTVALDQFAVTIPSVANTTVSVSYTSGGVDQVATEAGGISVDYGTSLTATWTAVSGYQITANAEQTINPVVATQALTAPTVEAVSQEATVSNVSFSPSANGKATVTATITGPAMTATLTYGGSQYNANVVNGSVTFENVSVGQTSDSYFAPTEYSLTTDAGQTTGQTSGLVDGTSWINENASTTGVSAGGTWTNATGVVYGENNKATIKDNRFEATSAAPTAAGGLVVLTMNVNFPTFSDAMVDGDAQGAITLREVNDTPTFSVLTTNESGKVWTDVTGAGSVNTNIDYVITLTFNYAANKYTAAVGGTTLSAAGGVSEFDILKNASSVQNIDFVGEGVLEYIKGDVASEGAMVEDAQHNKYATVDAAIAAYNADKTIGQLTMLHPGSVPSGWKVVNGIISKIIKGWKLIAY